MRCSVARAHLLLFVVSGGIAAPTALIAGCQDEPAARPKAEKDAGEEETAEEEEEEPTPEPEPEDTGPACDLDADFTTGIADAAIADGQSTTALCVGCTRKNCPSVQTCNQTCACKSVAGGALECFAKTSGGGGCTDAFAESAEALPIAKEMFTCSKTKCAEECQINPFKDAS